MLTIEQKLIAKLEPHAKRIKDGEGNDFDYLPAVLFHLIEEQKCQAQFLGFIKSSADTIGVQGQTQITAFESAAQRKMDQIMAVIKDMQTQIHNSQSSMSEQIVRLASAHAEHIKKTNEGLNAIDLQVESLVSITQRSHLQFMRLLIAGLIASTVMIGLAIAILQRH